MIFKTSSMLRYKNNRSMEEVFQPANTGSSRVCVSRKVRDFTNGWGASFIPPIIYQVIQDIIFLFYNLHLNESLKFFHLYNQVQHPSFYLLPNRVFYSF